MQQELPPEPGPRFAARGGRPLIMGILNLTPDSFADGGRHLDPDRALRHAGRMLAQGADFIDVGGESTRPGARAVPESEQRRRVEPVIAAIRQAHPEARISIDTTRAAVAEGALAAGADLVNDVSAGCDDPAMLPLLAEAGVDLVVMHGRAGPSLDAEPGCADPMGRVLEFLRRRVGAAEALGLAAEHLWLDPGIGFGKTREQNLRLLRELARLTALGHRTVLGVSRKRFMGRICAGLGPEQLLPATCACTALGVMAGVGVFRVHDVAENRQVADVVAAIRAAGADSAVSVPAGPPAPGSG